MNSEERVINAIMRKEVDRIPTFEWTIDKKVIEKMIPGADEEEFIYKMQMDAFVVEVDYMKEEIEPGLFKDEWGKIEKFSDESHSVSAGSIVSSMDDFNRLSVPDPKSEFRFQTFEKMLKKHGGKKALVLHLNDVLSIPRNLMGYENLFINIAANPDLVKALVDMSADYNIELAKQSVKKGAKIIFTGDDYAYDKGLLLNPKAFDEIFYPGFKKVIKGFKDAGLLVIKHTDGDICSIIDKLVDSGIDCLDPIDPSGGMDMAAVKKKYGNRISLKGNVNCAYTLSFGSVDETVRETKQCIKDGGPGYGYILSSSNSIHSSVKPENYRAMLETLIEYGNYPINF